MFVKFHLYLLVQFDRHFYQYNGFQILIGIFLQYHFLWCNAEIWIKKNRTKPEIKQNNHLVSSIIINQGSVFSSKAGSLNPNQEIISINTILSFYNFANELKN